MSKKILFILSLATIAAMVVLGLISVWFEIWMGKPFASLGIILTGSIASHLVSWLFTSWSPPVNINNQR